MKKSNDSKEYAEQLAIQMRKGLLAFCVLTVCDGKPLYTNEIVKRFHTAGMVVVEGTIYALLSRLQKDGLLSHTWKESEQGPPRKYYQITKFGKEVKASMQLHIDTLQGTLDTLRKGIL